MTSREWIEVPLSVVDKIGQWGIWAGVKLVVVLPGIGIWTWKQLSALSLHLAMGCDRFYQQLITPLDAIPYGGMAGSKLIEVEAKALPVFETCTDILEVIEGKHVLLIGGSGDGKTTTAMYIAYSVGGTIKVYDADAAADEWVGLPVVGRCANFREIEEAMEADLIDLQERTILRGQQGSHACDGQDVVTIAEEFPLLVGEVEIAPEWLVKHGKRGRRVKKFIIAIAQNDTVANFGIQGDAGVMDSFRIVRLGKKAQAYARKLKNDALVEWLQADRSRILVDDVPVQLPSYREIQRVIQQGSRGLLPPATQLQGGSREIAGGFPDQSTKTPETAPETTENQGFQASETGFSETFEGGEIGLLNRILAAIREERSDDWITKNVIMASQRIGYYKAKEQVERIREML